MNRLPLRSRPSLAAEFISAIPAPLERVPPTTTIHLDLNPLQGSLVVKYGQRRQSRQLLARRRLWQGQSFSRSASTRVLPAHAFLICDSKQTLDDVKIKTGFGGMRMLHFRLVYYHVRMQVLADTEVHAVTLISLCLILSLTLVEFLDYRAVHLKPSILVDKSRGEKLVVDLNITFPRVPCYRAFPLACPSRVIQKRSAQCVMTSVLSVDIMDISGEHQNGQRDPALPQPTDAHGSHGQMSITTSQKSDSMPKASP